MLGYRTVHFPTSDDQLRQHDAAWLRSYHQFRDQQSKPSVKRRPHGAAGPGGDRVSRRCIWPMGLPPSYD
jgi:hypothetical protein